MSGPVGSQQWMYSSGFYPHEIDNSARLDNNSYYTRTPSSASNRTTWTWSAWIKMPPTTSQGTLFFAEPSVTDYCGVIITGAGQLQLINRPPAGVNASVISAQVFRDPSAWYHIVGVWDTTNSTQSERVRLYVNGERITSFSTLTLPPQNAVGAVNSAGSHRIGATVTASSGVGNVYNGYMSEVNFIDGQALEPTSFGETKADTWIPIKYTGSYGTNGYYLDFATRATDPIDASGNGNNWTDTNVVATDWMLDSPTNNFATLNPLSQFGNPPFSEGNLKVDQADGGDGVFASIHPIVKKYYWEALLSSGIQGYGVMACLGNTSSTINTLYYTDGRIYVANALVTSSATTATSGDIIGIEYDPAAETIKFFKNNTQIGITYAATGDNLFPFTGGTGAGSGVSVLNFGQDSSFAGNKTAQGNTDANGIGDFYYAPPAGYLALCTANLPDPVAAINPAVNNSPQDHFNTVLYTGNGSTNNITGVGFQPDFVWIKSRSEAYWHRAFDVLRGATKQLYPNDSAAEATESTSLTAFGSDGFTLGSFQYTNNNTTTFASWNWKAGGSGVSNTDGDITSTVSANTDAGFSIVTWTGNSTFDGVGHGLDEAPEFVIYKSRVGTGDWYVWTTAIDGTDDYLKLNGTQGASASAPANSLTATTITNWNYNSSQSPVAYCFHGVEGFSKFGSYTGNGNADGPFVYCGFRPAFVIVKNASAADSWFINDNKRNSYNLVNSQLFANTGDAEADSRGLDFLSNGFKIRDTSTSHNGNGNTIIYMAFAEMPFKYANAR